MSGLPHALTRLTVLSSHSLRDFASYFCADGTDPRQSGNKHGVVILGKTGLVNVPVRL